MTPKLDVEHRHDNNVYFTCVLIDENNDSEAFNQTYRCEQCGTLISVRTATPPLEEEL